MRTGRSPVRDWPAGPRWRSRVPGRWCARRPRPPGVPWPAAGVPADGQGASRRRCRSRQPGAGRPHPAGGAGVEVGAGQEEHVLGSINHPVGVEQLAEAQRAAAQQGSANGELAGLVLAEDRVALGDLEQGPEPRLQLRPATKHGEALGGEGLAAGGQLATAVVSVFSFQGCQPHHQRQGRSLDGGRRGSARESTPIAGRVMVAPGVAAMAADRVADPGSLSGAAPPHRWPAARSR